MKKTPKRTINIGIVCSAQLGGSGVVGSELAKYLAEDDKYKIVFIGDEFPFRLNKNQVEFHKIEKLNHGLFTHPLKESALTEGIVEAVIKHKLDIIHAHFAIPYAYCAIQAKRILKSMGINISVVTTLHGTDVLTLGRNVPAIMKNILDESDAVTAVSMDLALHAKQLYNTKKDIRVIYNFINFKQYPKARKNTLLRSRFAKGDEKVFVHISNFRPVKRVNDTLKVFLKSYSSVPGVLLLIGEGPDIEGARKLAKTMKNQDSIHFIGRVKNPYKYLQIADALVITSSYESFSLAALEAIGYGVPVFGARVGGLPEVVTHGKSGYLEDLGNIDAISNDIKAHFSDKKVIAQMKKEAILLSKEFDAKKIIPNYERIYNQLMLSRVLGKTIPYSVHR